MARRASCDDRSPAPNTFCPYWKRQASGSTCDRGFAGTYASEDQQLHETVPAEAIGAVQPARRLTDRVQATHIGAVVLGAHPHPAHGVVRGGRDLDRFAGDVQHLQVQLTSVAGRVLRLDDPGRVELDQLGVAQPGSRLHGQPEGVARVLVSP